MIKNIVFDVGNVLLKYEPLQYLRRNFDEDTSLKLFKLIFDSKEWSLLDEGLLTQKEAIEIFDLKFPSNKDKIIKVMNEWNDTLTPIDETVEFLKSVKQKGLNTYVLSNYQSEPFEYTKNKFEFFKYIDDFVISARIKLIKPNPQIYTYIINTFNINPNESIFIDDRKENIDAAKEIGFNVIHFTSPNTLPVI